MYDITIRAAQLSDAPIIAKVVAMAIGDEVALNDYCGENYIDVLTEIARTEATQYCWQNAIIAECNGIVAGAIVGYDGAQLEPLREGTFNILRNTIGRVPTIAAETEAGEYYLDTLAVMPQFRGKGVGRILINALCERASSEGHERVGLIVDTDNPNAERLYTSQGFKRVGERIFFGHKMHHLQRQTNKEGVQ